MSSETETAEDRFRRAFERLKANKPEVLPAGTPVSQNNVAKEADVDPTALRISRYPTLIREIQTFVEIRDKAKTLQRERQSQRKHVKEDLVSRNKTLTTERDEAQSKLVSVERRVLELLQENARLRAKLDERLPPPTRLGE
ncbi:hypothetical protein [Cupriavidus neocaledonicus]|uniref:BZIP domain-containing protein n=1 Tax=Cupriavidus neocaledonicus TaxID=1040979 RepID=A0ABY1V0I5_9BURK|nr:hypothetical protein [Cupriavidus neocaledonicus]SOZ36198.1 conserved hypothetical protein [Cupriavidus neocaledonicus]